MSTNTSVTTHPHWIAGESFDSGPTYPVYDPYTEQVIAHVADGDGAAADAAAVAAEAASAEWAATPLEVRSRIIGRVATLLQSRRDELVELTIADTGTRRAVAEATQVDAAIARLRQWAAASPALLELPVAQGSTGIAGRVTRLPVGVVACISPYNFPLLAMIGKVAPALFAGNTVVMKPAPQDPLQVIELAEAFNEALHAEGAPAGAVNLITGSGAETGAALVEHPAVRAVSFTGSTVVGTSIYRSAAPTMKRLLLELGGKGALVVRSDANLDAVVEAATRAWTQHSGQICLTPSRIIVDDSVRDEVVERMRAVLGGLVYGDPRDSSTTTVPLISELQRDRVAALVDTAREQGAVVESNSAIPDRGWFSPATLVLDATSDMTVMQEEAFGPVVCVSTSGSDEEAIAIANSTRYGLSDSVYSRDVQAAEKIAFRLRSAQVGINTTVRRADLPFGGNRDSGLGRSGGSYALDSYTDLRATTIAQG